jgi:hypothetical protein
MSGSSGLREHAGQAQGYGCALSYALSYPGGWKAAYTFVDQGDKTLPPC